MKTADYERTIRIQEAIIKTLIHFYGSPNDDDDGREILIPLKGLRDIPQLYDKLEINSDEMNGTVTFSMKDSKIAVDEREWEAYLNERKLNDIL